MGVLQNFHKFRVRVWKCYRTSTSLGYGHGSVTELTRVPGIVARAYRTHRSSGRVQKVLYPYPGHCGTGCTNVPEVPGTVMNVLQNSQNFRVRAWKCYRTHKSSGYCCTGVQNVQKFRAGIHMLYPYPRVFVALAYRACRSFGYEYECPTELTKVLRRVIPG